jgi:hypothetical protein
MLPPRSALLYLSVFLANFLWYIDSFFWYSYILTFMQWTSISLLAAPLFYWICIFPFLGFWLFWFKVFVELWVGAKFIKLKKLTGGVGVDPWGLRATLRWVSWYLAEFGVIIRLDRLANGLGSLALWVAGTGELHCCGGCSLWPWINWHLCP